MHGALFGSATTNAADAAVATEATTSKSAASAATASNIAAAAAAVADPMEPGVEPFLAALKAGGEASVRAVAGIHEHTIRAFSRGEADRLAAGLYELAAGAIVCVDTRTIGRARNCADVDGADVDGALSSLAHVVRIALKFVHARDVLPPSLLKTATALLDIVVHLPSRGTSTMLSQLIRELCEAWWVLERADRDELANPTVLFLLAECAKACVRSNDSEEVITYVKRLWAMRTALEIFDYSDDSFEHSKNAMKSIAKLVHLPIVRDLVVFFGGLHSSIAKMLAECTEARSSSMHGYYGKTIATTSGSAPPSGGKSGIVSDDITTNTNTDIPAAAAAHAPPAAAAAAAAATTVASDKTTDTTTAVRAAAATITATHAATATATAATAAAATDTHTHTITATHTHTTTDIPAAAAHCASRRKEQSTQGSFLADAPKMREKRTRLDSIDSSWQQRSLLDPEVLLRDAHHVKWRRSSESLTPSLHVDASRVRSSPLRDVLRKQPHRKARPPAEKMRELEVDEWEGEELLEVTTAASAETTTETAAAVDAAAATTTATHSDPTKEMQRRTAAAAAARVKNANSTPKANSALHKLACSAGRSDTRMSSLPTLRELPMEVNSSSHNIWFVLIVKHPPMCIQGLVASALFEH